MKFNVLASGFPLPGQCKRQGTVFVYDLEAALVGVEAEIKKKTNQAEGFSLVIEQREMLRWLIEA